ncbi:MAG: tail fiber domain-containing protein [Planctomycetota bacterium]|jgi:hypothetical protein
METTNIFRILVLALALMVASARVRGAEPMGCAFTYQGRLLEMGSPAEGEYDFQFKLYDAPMDGNQVDGSVDVNEQWVSDGYFTVLLDFGCDVFNGDRRWLEAAVRPGEFEDPNTHITLNGRQEVTPTPYAIYARTARGDNDWMVDGNDMYSIPSGNLGIGTTSPGARLDVKGSGTTSATSSLRVLNSTNAPGFVVLDNGNAGLGTGAQPNSRFSIKSTGGTVLDIQHSNGGVLSRLGEDATQGAVFRLMDNAGNAGVMLSGHGPSLVLLKRSGDGAVLDIANSNGQVLSRLWEHPTEGGAFSLYNNDGSRNVSISADGTSYFLGGKVGIGTLDPTEELEVNGNININSVYKIGGDTVLSVNGISNTLLGVRVGANITDAAYNTFLGEDAGKDCNTGLANVAVGYQALYSNTTGYDNSAVGAKALYSNTTGVRNTGIGGCANYYNQEGSRNTIIGFQAGRANANHNKSGNVFLGYNAGYEETGDNKLYIANDRGIPLIHGDFSSSRVGIARKAETNAFEVEGEASKTVAGGWLANSDVRIKDDVRTITNALQRLDKVRLVSFKYNGDYRSQHSSIEDRRYMNVVAQEFREVFPEYVKSSGEKLPNGEDILQVDTYPLTVYSAAALQELHVMVKDKDTEIAELKDRLSKLEGMMAKFAREQEGGL